MPDELEPWQRPPFEPGNELSITHGAYSPRRVDPLAEHILATVLVEAQQPGSSTLYLAEVSYRPALHAWARTEARVQLVHEWLLDHGGDVLDDIDDLGRSVSSVQAAAVLLNRLEASAARQRDSLGLSPLARARLGRDVAAGAVDVAKLLAKLAEEGAA